MSPSIQVAIRSLVEFICRKGDLSNDFSPSARAIEGIRLHQLVQRQQSENYQSEVPLSYTYPISEELSLVLSGRADGIIRDGNNITVDEIKSTAIELEHLNEPLSVHLAQAKVYAFILAKTYQLDHIHVRLTYIQIESEEIKYFTKNYTLENLSDFMRELIDQYRQFILISQEGKKQRDRSLFDLPFPYSTYRPGQHEMAKACFKAVKEGEVLFIQAATGIGKTLSTLYPALKAMALAYTSKIMYLTAKTITRQVALESLDLLCANGAYLRYVTITAKEKICFTDEKRCHPDHCPYAHGHYDRINAALLDCLQHEIHWTREMIEQYARKHQVCPFEFSLDLYEFADVSISDYNYAFDPKVNLKRAFEEKNDYTLLVDEAHNLVDRAREMYSAKLSLTVLENGRKAFKPKKGALYRSLKKLTDYLKEIAEATTNKPYVSQDIPKSLPILTENFLDQARKVLPEMPETPHKDQLLEIFFMLNDVSRVIGDYTNDYICYMEEGVFKLFCLNPASCLSPIYRKVKSVILFSATLLPIKYFFQLLGGQSQHKKLYYASPFPKENRCLLIASDVNATYRHREQSYQKIITYLQMMYRHKNGHYLIFFPSYAYLNQTAMKAKAQIDDAEIYVQESQMSEDARESFLKVFTEKPQTNRLFFCVLGGLFSEGIDLKGDQVVGVMIVSVGLPQICLERELIRQHFDQDQLGYAYAYIYPGFNKVLQATGRLIRTMEDRGVILLLDNRYATQEYLRLFPEERTHARLIKLSHFDEALTNFYHISVEKNY